MNVNSEGTQLGSIDWYDERRAYGFIGAESGQRFFFHRLAVIGFRRRGGVQVGEAVSFTVSQDQNGRPMAVCVRPF